MTGSARRIDRRAALTGGAGLLVGAAGGAGVTGWLRPPEPADDRPPVPSPGEELMTEHGVLKRLLLAYRAATTRLAAGQPVPLGAITDAAQIVSDVVEGFHEGLEEAYVFPRVAPTQPELVRTLLVQHDRGRHLTAAVLDLTATATDAAAIQRPLLGYLSAFVAMYEPHEAWEDTVVYPELRAVTRQRELDELAERFADLLERQYGDHALNQILGRVAGVEEQLGVGDLAAFTPPAPGARS